MEDLKKLGYGTSLQNESAIGGTRALTIATGFDAGQQDNNPDNYPDDPVGVRVGKQTTFRSSRHMKKYREKLRKVLLYVKI
jgi:hypothetical protein